MIQTAWRAIARILPPYLVRRIAAVESRLTRLESSVAASARGDPEVAPMLAHSNCAIRALSFGVAAVYGGQVDGDIAEFGTMTGTTAVALARAIASCDAHLGYALDIAGLRPKQLHLFDSFEGLPPANNPVDLGSPHVRSGAWGPGTCVGLSQEELFSRVTAELDAARVKIFAGWFAETLKTLPRGTKYALVHIDSDLYSSARDVLDHVFGNQMIVQGAQIFFDDWNCNAASPSFGERRAWAEAVKKFAIVASDEGGYGVFGHRFIVHGYRGCPGSLDIPPS